MVMVTGYGLRATEQMFRPWPKQARQLTTRRETVAHLGCRSCCVHNHTGKLSRVESAGGLYGEPTSSSARSLFRPIASRVCQVWLAIRVMVGNIVIVKGCRLRLVMVRVTG